jgi:hypothetical protein
VVVGDWLPLGLALACLVLCRIDRTSSGGSDKERG